MLCLNKHISLFLYNSPTHYKAMLANPSECLVFVDVAILATILPTSFKLVVQIRIHNLTDSDLFVCSQLSQILFWSLFIAWPPECQPFRWHRTYGGFLAGAHESTL